MSAGQRFLGPHHLDDARGDGAHWPALADAGFLRQIGLQASFSKRNKLFI